MSDPRALALAPVVSAAIDGDRTAFDALVRETSGVVCAIALAVTRDVQASEDIAQEVYLDAWKGIGKLRNHTSFLPWLRQLTRNKSKQFIRGAVRRRRYLTNDGSDTLLEAATDPRPDALEGIVAAEDRVRLREALDGLPVSAREVLVLYYREGQSVRQTAELLGIGEDAVKQRLSRARVRVRSLLHDDAASALARTAPGLAFGAAVATAINAATPGVAAAASIGLGKTASGGKLLGSFGLSGAGAAVAAGFLGGLLGSGAAILASVRKLRREARNPAELRAATVVGVTQTALVLGFLGTMILAPRPIPVTVGFLTMLGGFIGLAFVYIPRVTAGRRAEELLTDPDASERHRRDRRAAIVGAVLGFVLGSIPIVWLWIRFY